METAGSPTSALGAAGGETSAAAAGIEGIAKLMEGGDMLSTKIETLREEQKRLRGAKAEVSKALRNARKKNTRIKRKARELTDEDLLENLRQRRSMQTQSPRAAEAATEHHPQ
jgi:hypothetical protein